MKNTVVLVVFLLGIGFVNVYAWQQGIIYVLQQNGCQVIESNASHLKFEKLMGALAFVLCYPLSILSIRLVSQFSLRKVRQKNIYMSLVACIVGSNLGGLLRSMIIVKIHLQEAFSNGEENPVIFSKTLAMTEWMSYGLLSGLLLCAIILVPVGLLDEDDD